MTITTYATTSECSQYAGMKSCDTTTRPTAAMVDIMRERAYAIIGRIIGYGTADTNGVAKAMELKLVQIMISNVINNTIYNATLSQEEINVLLAEFNPNSSFGWHTYEPNKDGSLYGSD